MTAVAAAIWRIKQARPAIPVLVDPILGDAGRLYVAAETAAAIRDKLLPLATIATPNLFELQWLTGASAETSEEIVQAAQRLGPPTVVVTSALNSAQGIWTLLVTAANHAGRSAATRASIPNGAGDLFAGLFLGYLQNGQSVETALDASLSDLYRVLAASAGHPVLQLSVLLR